MDRGKDTQVTDLPDQLSRGQRLLGLDVGRKTIGIAVSDTGLMVATPMTTVRRTKLKTDLDALRNIVAENHIGGLVLGLPVNMDGSEGRRCQSVRRFAAEIKKPLALPLALWDERLSTVAVTRALTDAGMSRRRRDEVVDEMAAAYILQGALDRLRAASDETR